MSEEEFTRLLRRVEVDDASAWQDLMQLVYQDLKRVAHAQMNRIAPGQTLSTTVLVHEAFEKLAVQAGLEIADRTHFYALCAGAMRQIIIDHYRRRTATKRKASAELLDEFKVSGVNAELDAAISQLGQALELLGRRDQKLLEAFEMRYFAGLSDAEIALRLEVSERSVHRLIARGRARIAASLEPMR
ncbi:MAG: ECF-type sigma factor [Myxococcota bacterium]